MATVQNIFLVFSAVFYGYLLNLVSKNTFFTPKNISDTICFTWLTGFS